MRRSAGIVSPMTMPARVEISPASAAAKACWCSSSALIAAPFGIIPALVAGGQRVGAAPGRMLGLGDEMLQRRQVAVPFQQGCGMGEALHGAGIGAPHRLCHPRAMVLDQPRPSVGGTLRMASDMEFTHSAGGGAV